MSPYDETVFYAVIYDFFNCVYKKQFRMHFYVQLTIRFLLIREWWTEAHLTDIAINHS